MPGGFLHHKTRLQFKPLGTFPQINVCQHIYFNVGMHCTDLFCHAIEEVCVICNLGVFTALLAHAVIVHAVLRPEGDNINGGIFVYPFNDVVGHLVYKALVATAEYPLTEKSVGFEACAVGGKLIIFGVCLIIVLGEIFVSVRRKEHLGCGMMSHGKAQTAFYRFLQHTVLLVAVINTTPCEYTVVAVAYQPIKKRNVQLVVGISLRIAVLNDSGAVWQICLLLYIFNAFQGQFVNMRYFVAACDIGIDVRRKTCAHIALQQLVHRVNSASLILAFGIAVASRKQYSMLAEVLDHHSLGSRHCGIELVCAHQQCGLLVA